MRKILFTIAALLVCLTMSAQYNKGVVKELLMSTDTTYSGQTIQFPTGRAEVKISRVTIPVGVSTGWHKHDSHVFAYVQQGCLNLELEGGISKEYKKDSTIAEVVNTLHNGPRWSTPFTTESTKATRMLC